MRGFRWHPPKQDAEEDLEDEQEDILEDKWPCTADSSPGSSETTSLSSESPEPVEGPACGGHDALHLQLIIGSQGLKDPRPHNCHLILLRALHHLSREETLF